METVREILYKKMNWETGFPLNEPERMYIISAMEEYAQKMSIEFCEWYRHTPFETTMNKNSSEFFNQFILETFKKEKL